MTSLVFIFIFFCHFAKRPEVDALPRMDKFVTRQTDGRSGTAKPSSSAEGTGARRPHPIQLTRGDLFTCPASTSLAHCISADVRMGKGIAVEFRKRFGRIEEIKAQGQKPGGVAVLPHKGRFIYNMVTKQRHFHKPTYAALKSSLKATKEHCTAKRVRELAMPRIGCGLDGLEWQRVLKIIQEVFQDSSINVTVYTL